MPPTEIESYIEASKSASSRSRFVILVLVTGSIMSFAAAWNSRHEGWMNQRLELAKIAVLFCEHPQEEPSAGGNEKLPTPGKGSMSGDPGGPPVVGGNPKPSEPNWDSSSAIEKLAARLKEQNVSEKESYDAAVKQRNQARDFYKHRFRSCAQLGDGLQELEKVNVENSDLIHVPFFGFSFDINDLGMLSGITFVIVLIWLRLSLETEFRSVRLTFAKAKALDLNDDEKAKTLNVKDERAVTKHPILTDAYQLLGIYQVFTCVETPKSSTSKYLFQPQVIFIRLMRASFLLACLIAVGFLVLDIYPLQLVRIPADILIASVIVRFLIKARQKALSHRTDSNERGDITEEDPLEVTSHSHFWQHLSLGLYGMPGIVLLYIFRDDLATLEFGWSISRTATSWIMGMELLLLIVTWLLVLDCMRIARETNDEWDDTAETIDKETGGTQGAASSG